MGTPVPPPGGVTEAGTGGGDHAGDAALDSFVRKIEGVIAARVDAHLAASANPTIRPVRQNAGPGRRAVMIAYGVGGIITGVPLTAVLVRAASPGRWAWEYVYDALGIWIVIVIGYFLAWFAVLFRETHHD